MLENISLILGNYQVPSFTVGQEENHYMLPFNLETINNLPKKWANFVNEIKNKLPKFNGTAYLTIDQKVISHSNKSHRRGGAHIDGNYISESWGGGGWLNGKDGKTITPKQHSYMYEQKGLGTILISDYAACKIWEKPIDAKAGAGGNCEHLRDELDRTDFFILPANTLCHLSSDCVHESLPINEVTKRTLIRITLPIE